MRRAGSQHDASSMGRVLGSGFIYRICGYTSVDVLVFRRIRQIGVRLERVLHNQKERRACVDNARCRV